MNIAFPSRFGHGDCMVLWDDFERRLLMATGPGRVVHGSMAALHIHVLAVTGIIREMEARGMQGTQVLSRQADEEALSIVHMCRKAVLDK